MPITISGYTYNLPLNITDFHEATLRQISVPNYIARQVPQCDITLDPKDAVDANIVLRLQPAYLPVSPYLITLVPSPDPLRPAIAVFPAPGNVDNTAPRYGATGVEFAGTLELPGVGDVKQGVQYGEDGTEFTGTYYVTGGGGGLNPGSVLIDPLTGRRYIYISDKIIIGAD